MMDRGWIKDGSRMDRGWIEDGSRMDPGWIEDGSRMDRGWIEYGSRMDRGWIEAGSRMDRGWIEYGSWVGNLCVVGPQLKFSKPPRKRESSRSIVDRVDEVWLTEKVIWIVVDFKKERLF